MIFANSQAEADDIARIINSQCSQEIAISYHSTNDQRVLVEQTGKYHTGLERFADPSDPIQIIVAIGKLNESINVPTVENVVFWRGTDVAKIFLQQFGRGLR
jgi:superfamily II DNA or RNA helicase